VSSLRFGFDTGIGLPVFAWSLTTALGVLLFAFVLRRPARRERVPVGPNVAAAVALAPPGADAVHPDEANLPRWLRPTLREQRQWSDRATYAVREPELFDSAPRGGADRRTIGYRLVRLSDGPDDLRSNEISRLDRGDEVEIIGDQGGFLQVRTPSGLEGWVPRIAIVR
jgi:SH3 domain-containing protein